MCYFSTRLHPSQYRDAKVGEDLTIKHDAQGHGYAVAKSDDKIVCIRSAAEVHIAKLELHPNYANATPQLRAHYPEIGQPVSARFQENHETQYTRDMIIINGRALHIIYLADGVEFYIGPKRPTMAEKIGVDDPSIVHDHKVDDAPSILTRIAALVR